MASAQRPSESDGGRPARARPTHTALYLWPFLFAAPNFVNSMAHGDFVYFFFRETAVEYTNCGKVSRESAARSAPRGWAYTHSSSAAPCVSHFATNSKWSLFPRLAPSDSHFRFRRRRRGLQRG